MKNVIHDLKIANEEMANDLELANFFNLSKVETEKIKYSIIYFLEEAKENKFNVYKTHLFNFFSLTEMYYAQEYSNFFTKMEFRAMKDGPVPDRLYALMDHLSNPLIDMISDEKEDPIELLSPFFVETRLSQRRATRVFLKSNVEFTDYYFSISDLKVMKKASKKIIELKTVDKISEYLHDTSESWKISWKECNENKKQSKLMNFSLDFGS